METTTAATAAQTWIPTVLLPIIHAFQAEDASRPFMFAILALLVAGTVIILERLYMILFVYSANPAPLLQKVQRLIQENRIDQAVQLCNTQRHAAIYQVFKAALLNAHRPPEEIQEHVDVATLGVVPNLQKRMPYLFTIANVATLLGLLGTIMGLIQAFSAVGALEGSQKQLALSSGIALAMNATAFGLVTAIPSMLAYGFLFNRINSIIDEIQHYSGKLVLLLRTGSQYYDRFKADSSVTTEQTPRKMSESVEVLDHTKTMVAPRKKGDDAA